MAEPASKPAACMLNRAGRAGVPFTVTASAKPDDNGRLACIAISAQSIDLVMTSVSAALPTGTAPAWRRGNAGLAGNDGTLTRACTHRHTQPEPEPLRASQEKRKAPAKGGQLTTTAYASVQDLRRIGVAAGKAKTLDPSPQLRTTPWA